MKVLVLAPHPDDDVLGCGGMLARFGEEGHETFVAIVTRGDAGMFDPAVIEQGRQEALEAHRALAVHRTVFMEGFPAALLDTVPQAHLVEAFRRLLRDIAPDVLLIPFAGDLHRDHRIVFETALASARPDGIPGVRSVLAYETLSQTNWNAPFLTPSFVPTVYLDVSHVLDRKLKAMSCFRTQIRPFPHERSLEAIEALARFRGSTVGAAAAEAFVLIRSIVKAPVTDAWTATWPASS
jgi:LmbE family N-acetylglucosaminyl deacetylase